VRRPTDSAPCGADDTRDRCRRGAGHRGVPGTHRRVRAAHHERPGHRYRRTTCGGVAGRPRRGRRRATAGQEIGGAGGDVGPARHRRVAHRGTDDRSGAERPAEGRGCQPGRHRTGTGQIVRVLRPVRHVVRRDRAIRQAVHTRGIRGRDADTDTRGGRDVDTRGCRGVGPGHGCRGTAPRRRPSHRDPFLPVHPPLGTEGGQDFKGARLIVRWDASDRFDVTLSGDIYSDDSEPSPSRLIAVRPDHASAPLLTPFLDVGRYESYSLYQSQRGYGLAGRNRLDGYGVSGQLNYDFSDNLTLTSISAYRTYDGFFQVDLDGTSYGMTTQHVGLDFEQFSQELRVNGSLAGGRLDYTVGGYFYSGRGASAGLIELTFQAVNPPAPPPPAASFHIQDDIVEIENKSAFLHTIFRATDALTLSLGIRYTDEWKTLVLHRKDPVTLEFQPLEGANGRFDGDHVDYRVSLDYRWNPNLLTYVSFATGFKGGGISSRPYRAEQVVPFGPEKLEAWEVGFKSDFFDRRARFNVSAFHNKYDDIQLTVRSGTGIFAPPASVTVNAGEAEMTGFEAEFSLNPTSGLAIDAAVGYLDFEYTELSPGVLASGLAMHHVTPFTPEWKWSLGAQYEFALGDGRTITPRFDVAYQSEIYANPVNNPMWVVDDYTVADARVTYRNPTSGVEVALAVTNLFDKYYYTSLYDNLYGSQGTVIANVARPREWSISVRKNF